MQAKQKGESALVCVDLLVACYRRDFRSTGRALQELSGIKVRTYKEKVWLVINLKNSSSKRSDFEKANQTKMVS